MLGQRFVYRNKKITSHANGQACQNCGWDREGEVVAAHSNLLEHGRGSHHKTHDIYVAFLCTSNGSRRGCHEWLDYTGFERDPSDRYECNATEKREMFLRAMHKTQLILVRDGVLR